jgi:hypothetical protein
MGAWGPAIFYDDTAADIRGDYRELLEDQVPDEEATQRVIAAYTHLGADESYLLWLALAAAQYQVGRLEDQVKERALAVIDSGEGLDLWREAGPKELTKRQSVLAKLRDQLTGPPRPRNTIRRPWRHVTDLMPGMVLAYTSGSGALALFRVVRVDDGRAGAIPVLERLDWDRRSLPSERKLRRLAVRMHVNDYAPPREERWSVARNRKKDPDWRDSGFTLVGAAPARSGDATAPICLYAAWITLRRELEHELGSGGA